MEPPTYLEGNHRIRPFLESPLGETLEVTIPDGSRDGEFAANPGETG